MAAGAALEEEEIGADLRRELSGRDSCRPELELGRLSAPLFLAKGAKWSTKLLLLLLLLLLKFPTEQPTASSVSAALGRGDADADAALR